MMTALNRREGSVYSWLVFIHLVGLVVFAIAHGVSTFVAFRVRSEREPGLIAALLGMSQIGVGGLYVGLLLLGIGGLGAAWQGGLLTAPWVVASYVALGIVLVTMWSVASPYYGNLRKLAADPAAGSDGRLAAALDSRRPEVLLGVGGAGLLVLIWLMVMKPG
jgi:Predicted integral membrane protein (DUF2269)